MATRCERCELPEEHASEGDCIRAQRKYIGDLEFVRLGYIGVLDATKAEKNRAVIQASNAEDIIAQLRQRVADLETEKKNAWSER